MTAIRTATIIGAGIAGPVTAMALQRAGVEATVHEAYGVDASDVGAALMIAPNGMDALSVLGLDERVRGIGTPSPRMTIYSGTGKRLAEFRDLPQVPTAQTVARGDLYRELSAEAGERGVAIEYGKRMTELEQTGDGVSVLFSDGTQVESDVVIGADGIRSTIRPLLDPSAPEPEFGGLCGFGGWIPESGLTPTDGTYRMVFGRRGFFAHIVAEDGRALWFASIPQDPPLSIAEAEAVPSAQSLETLLDIFADDNSAAVEILSMVRPEDLMTTGNQVRLKTPTVWSRGRTIIIGDAAHAASSGSGQGASMAIESGIEVARCLRDAASVEPAFARYEELRRPRVEKVIAHGRRTDSNKAPGPVGRVLRDLVLPPMTKLAAKPERMAWLFAHQVDWDAPALASTEVLARA